MDGSTELVTAVLRAPVGVCLLARLELFGSGGRFGLLRRATPASVEAARASVEQMSLAELSELAVHAGLIDCGPWIPDAPETVADAYLDREHRRPLAEAFVERFGSELDAPLDRTAQQWWTSGEPVLASLAPLFRDYEQVYGDGQFTWAGLWTVTDPAPVLHAGLIDAWEMHPHPITRWHLPVLDAARICEIRRPDDWVRLVTDHPRTTAARGRDWERGLSDLPALVSLDDQHAARPEAAHLHAPDWRSVAEQYDAVHLTWGGLITTEGLTNDLDRSSIAVLRYWFSEHTLWLRDVFGDPTPLPHPHTPDEPRINEATAEVRRSSDLGLLNALLRR